MASNRDRDRKEILFNFILKLYLLVLEVMGHGDLQHEKSLSNGNYFLINGGYGTGGLANTVTVFSFNPRSNRNSQASASGASKSVYQTKMKNMQYIVVA